MYSIPPGEISGARKMNLNVKFMLATVPKVTFLVLDPGIFVSFSSFSEPVAG